MSRLRIGLVGTSHWATHVHGAVAAGHDDVELVAVWGRDRLKAEAAAAVLGCRAADSFDELMEQVDAVAFSVPPAVQGSLALQAAQRGRHLLLEKPLALDVGQAESVVEAVRDNDVASVLFVTRLWIPETAAWLDDLREVESWQSGRCAFVAALPEEMLEASPWRVDYGALWDVGPHALSVLERVLGDVVEVQGARGARDQVHLLLRHASGAVSSAELTLTAAPEASHTEFTFWGGAGRSRPAAPAQLGPEHNLRAYRRALDHLVAQVASGARTGHADAAYGLHLTRVLAAVETALRTGSRLAIDERRAHTGSGPNVGTAMSASSTS